MKGRAKGVKRKRHTAHTKINLDEYAYTLVSCHLFYNLHVLIAIRFFLKMREKKIVMI